MRKYWTKSIYLSLIMFCRHPASDSSKLQQFVFCAFMSELSSFLCLKLYSLNFAIAQAKKMLSIESSTLLVRNQFRIYEVCKNFVKCLPLTKPNRNIKYLVIFDLSRFSITFFLLPNQLDLSAHCSYHFSTSNVLRLRCNNTLMDISVLKSSSS